MYQSLSDYTNAEPLFLRGLEIREKVLGPEHQFTARNLMNLGSLYVQMRGQTGLSPKQIKAVDATMAAVRKQAKAAAGH